MLGALIGTGIGGYLGFIEAGVGGAIVGIGFGGVIGLLVGNNLDSVFLVVAFFVAFLSGAIWLFVLWDVGKP